MNILLISQCHKRALTETRRIIDQFAERCGERTWQTEMTQQGLDTLRKLLRKTARKNTAVACYWTRGKNSTELLWVVGNRNEFNHQGRVPTNRTQRNILRKTDEDSWQFSHSLQILTVLAALFHDLGKSSDGFQNKLKQSSLSFRGDPFRHEWISMRIFQAIVSKATTDSEWLTWLADFSKFERLYPEWQKDIFRDGLDGIGKAHNYAWHNLTPLAQAVGWLIVSHHRMPFYESSDKQSTRNIEELFNRHLKPIDGWVKNSSDEFNNSTNIKPFWTFTQLVTDSCSWRLTVARWAQRALEDRHLAKQTDFAFFDPLLMHLCRMGLMVGDHTYSSLASQSKYGDKSCALYANTEKNDSTKQLVALRQRLDEHLLGVARTSEKFSQLLPKIADNLPAIAYHKEFRRRTPIARFAWQNRAYELACSLQSKSEQSGFFGINMASTGCGKTLGNGRIMYGLSHPDKGARFTMALGLRVLTLQTGREYRDRMRLKDDDLAILVGGQAVIDLFNLHKKGIGSDDEFVELQQKEYQQYEQVNEFFLEKELMDKYGAGSESAIDLAEGYVHFDSPIEDHHFGTIIHDDKAKKLLYAPIVTCTIDHLVGATETHRGGKFIVPMLRLLSSDLILDEPDDFNLEDLPALSRLVNMAGMLGSRILLSSATLPPDLLTGLFEAYQAGRKIWNRHHGIVDKSIVCAWFDEKNIKHADCVDNLSFAKENKQFVAERLKLLSQAPVLRRADILPLNVKPERKLNFHHLAEDILCGVNDLHASHYQVCPHSQKHVSFGLIRMSNIEPLVELAQAMYASNGLVDTEIHLCVYHARQLFALRSDLEYQLDSILNRKVEEQVFSHSAVSSILQQSLSTNVIFIVLATPVAEVGRDHDYDWAIVEPSSMRSIIQLAGRVRRHRQTPVSAPNMKILSTNIRALKQRNGFDKGNTPVFCRPGFETRQTKLINEDGGFILSSHKTEEILGNVLEHINSSTRICNPGSEVRLANIEHLSIACVMNNIDTNLVNSWWRPIEYQGKFSASANPYLCYLQKQTPFRVGRAQTRYVYVENDEGELEFRMIEELSKSADYGFKSIKLEYNDKVKPWLHRSYRYVLEQLSDDLDNKDLFNLAVRFGYVNLESDVMEWNFHSVLGFW